MDFSHTLLVALASTTAGGGIAVVGILVKSWIDRRTRGDAVALALLKEKLTAYAQLAPVIGETYDGLEREFFNFEKPQEQWGMFLMPLHKLRLAHHHVLSARVLNALNKFMGQSLSVRPPEHKALMPSALQAQLDAAHATLLDAIRADVGTDFVSGHFEQLAPDPVQKLLKDNNARQLDGAEAKRALPAKAET